jgi:choline dehydrogenase
VTYVDENKIRVSSESAYLTSSVLARSNLKVAVHATVTKILFDHPNEKKTAIGVEFSRGEGYPLFRAGAKKEVILSYVTSAAFARRATLLMS